MVGTTINTRLQALLDTEIKKKDSHHLLLALQSKDGSVDFAGSAGDVNTDDPYFIASITKMYTTVIIMQLVDEGLIHLDAPINTYLPAEMLEGIHRYEGKDYSQQLKIYQLLHHTSGLADYFLDKHADGTSPMTDIKQGKDTRYGVHDVIDMVRQMKPKFAPDANKGKKSHYSDTNYQLLGAIIEEVTGHSVAYNYQERICQPLSLKATYLYNGEHPHPVKQPMQFYNHADVVNIPKIMSSVGADGGIVSTLGDSMRFLRAYFEGELFDKRHFSRMTAQWNTVFFPIQYGYGVMRFQLPRWMTLFRYSPELIGHSGASGSFMFFAPDEGIYLAGTINQLDTRSRPFKLMLDALNIATA